MSTNVTDFYPGLLLGPEISPLDAKVMGGVAVWHSLTARDEEAILSRLQQGLDRLRIDKSRHFGFCVAYTVGLEQVDDDKVRNLLAEVLGQQNEGALSRIPESNTGSTLWAGSYENSTFILNHFEGVIPLTNGDTPLGSVYSLLGGNNGRFE